MQEKKTREDYELEMKQWLKPVYGKSTSSATPPGYELVKIANWYMENINEPVLVTDTNLSKVFNINDKGYDEAMVWWALLLLPCWVKNIQDEDRQIAGLGRLYFATQNALPSDMRNLISLRYIHCFPFDNMEPELQDKIIEFNTWCRAMRDKLETFFLKYYWLGGGRKVEFILNKLYREHFNDDVSPFRFKEDKLIEKAAEVQVELIEVTNEEDNS